MTYKQTWHQEGVVYEFYGKVTMVDINNANAAWFGDKRYKDHRYSVWNYLNADVSAIKQEDAIEMAVSDWAASISKPEARVALVAQKSHAVKLCKQYIAELKKLNSSWEAQLFDTVAAAEQWGKDGQP